MNVFTKLLYIWFSYVYIDIYTNLSANLYIDIKSKIAQGRPPKHFHQHN